jgi:hypothetical protein
MTVALGHAHLPAIKFLHHDKFLASRQFVPPSLTSLARGAARHCASAHLPVSCNRDSFPATYQLCTATLVMLNKISTWTEKHVPYPPCTGTIFWLKYQDPARSLRRVTQPPFIAGPLCGIASPKTSYQHFR